jgi:hypothetical protein
MIIPMGLEANVAAESVKALAPVFHVKNMTCHAHITLIKSAATMVVKLFCKWSAR